MKKGLIIICILLAIVSSSDVYAGIGFKGGITFANWGGDGLENAENYSWKAGAKLGTYFAFPVGNCFTIQPEIFYSMKGWKYVYVGHDYENSWSLNYIDISVLAKFDMETGDAFRPTIFAGPYMCYLLNTKASIKIGEKSMSASLSDDIFKSTEIGLVLGGGFDFEGSGAVFTLEARYSFGLTPVLNMEENINNLGLTPVFNTNGNVINHSFSILGGVRF
ncbi:PorT family protein [bacterium]|nr:PorT family protein [bacterium]